MKFKKILFTLAFTLVNIVSFSQTNKLESTGDVGIGTLAPSAKLHIRSSGTSGQLDYNLIVQKTVVSDNDNSGVGILFSAECCGSFGKSAIVHERTGSYGIGNLYFLNNNMINTNTPTLSDARMTINSNGNVGIGTQTPSAKLETYNATAGVTSFKAYGVNGYLLIDNVGSGESYYNANKFHEFQIGGNAIMRVINNGNVGIGTTVPDQKLAVNGTIHSKEIIVDTNIAPDYVFQKYYTGVSELKSDYTFPTLTEIENFTKKNNHLPGVPSAKEAQEKGISLGEMSNILLQKIEELTLYTIEQQKELERLKAENANYKSFAERLSAIEKELKK